MKTLWLWPLLWLAASVHADSMRCGRYVISEGMSPYEVVSKCGDPAYQQVVREVVSVVVNRRSQVHGVTPDERVLSPHLQIDTQEQAPVYRDVDRWTYNLGSGQLLREVDFYNGAVIRIRTAGHAP